jgi:hypothetical protein
MQDRKNCDLFGPYDVKDEIGKARYDCSPHITVNHRAGFREFAHRSKLVAHGSKELLAEPWTL